MGAGSAKPVVSSRIASKSFLLEANCPKVRTRSPRTEQQTHPLSMVIKSSGASSDSATGVVVLFIGLIDKFFVEILATIIAIIPYKRCIACAYSPNPSSIATSPNSFSNTQIFPVIVKEST